LRTLAAGYGRNPSDIKVLFLANPIVDVSMETARERRRLEDAAKVEHIDMQFCQMSMTGDIDLAQFDPDEPLPELISNGHQSEVAKYAGRTPRSLAMEYPIKSSIDYTGSRRGPDGGCDAGGWRRRLPAVQQ